MRYDPLFDNSKMKTSVVLTLSSAATSSFAVLLMLYLEIRYYRMQQFTFDGERTLRKINMFALLALAATDLLSDLNYFLVAFEGSNTLICHLQAYFMQWFELSSILWTFALLLFFHIQCSWAKKGLLHAHVLKRCKIFAAVAAIVAWVIPLVLASVLFYKNEFKEDDNW